MSICVVLAILDVHWRSAALALRSSERAICIVALVVFGLVRVVPGDALSKQDSFLIVAIHFEACRSVTSAACGPEVRLADV